MYHEIQNADFLPLLCELLRFSDSVLDVGSGLGVLLEYYECRLIVALEIHRPYLEHRVYQAPHVIPLNADAKFMDQLFLPNSFTTVTLIDSLEHFTKKEGTRVLQQAEQIAKHRIIIFTPRGFFPQKGVDHYNLKGEVYQKHYSGWEAEELIDLGYHVIVLKGFHNTNNPSFEESYGTGHEPVDALIAWKTLDV
ncbi:class I SAM-dependent methyltransferase [Paenibacillus sp. Marseille-Q4541]|uniref:class I SAM-dependent methyltransferase n=1 Tax=Paenibacillus sp. Marseille-Q4541 TaxID=2831522 RepID=UPI001BA7987A|nr:class I SAM-dependent methyltransferase [Paenibacillus sp. Marseille-Q4541]